MLFRFIAFFALFVFAFAAPAQTTPQPNIQTLSPIQKIKINHAIANAKQMLPIMKAHHMAKNGGMSKRDWLDDLKEAACIAACLPTAEAIVACDILCNAAIN